MPSALEYSELVGESKELLEKYFLTCFRHGYVRTKGCLLPVYFKEFGDAIQNMEIRDDDVWVCSFPKTGTTWTQEMVWCIAKDLDFEGAKVNLPQRFPFLEHTPLFNYKDVLPKYPELELPEYVTDSIRYVNEMPSPRFIKSHLPFQLLPTQLQEGVTKAKIIYTARNAKDTCISYFHHCQLLEGYKGSFDEFAQLFITDSLCFAPFWENILSYWNHRDEPNVLFLKFEDMKKDLPSVVKKTLAFMGKELSPELIAVLCNHLTFENMKHNPAVNYEHVIEINRKYKFTDAKGSFHRSGQVGGWKAQMGPLWVAKFDHWTQEKLQGSDLSV